MTVIMSSLISEVKTGDVEEVKCILQRFGSAGDDIVNYQEPDRRETPLFCACARGFLTIVQILLSFKARLDLYTIWGGTPLHAAAENGHENVVRLLLQYGAFIDAQTHYGDTALHLAAFRGHLSVVKILVEANADVTLRNVKHNRPYEEAGINHHYEVGRYLSSHGSKKKKTPRPVSCEPVSVQPYRKPSMPVPSYLNIPPALNFNDTPCPHPIEYNNLSKDETDGTRITGYSENIQATKNATRQQKREPVESCIPYETDGANPKEHREDFSTKSWILREPVECDAPIADGMPTRKEPVESLDPTADFDFDLCSLHSFNSIGNGNGRSGMGSSILSKETTQLNREIQRNREELATVQNTLRQTRHEIERQRPQHEINTTAFLLDKEERYKVREQELKCKIKDMETKLY